MKFWIIIGILISTSIKAEVYFDVGLAHLFNTDYHAGYENTNTFGHLELGYTADQITFYLSHDSDIQQVDKGFNMIGVKYRFSYDH